MYIKQKVSASIRCITKAQSPILLNLSRWVKINVQRPIKGFENKKNADGTSYSWHQQLQATHQQVLSMSAYFLRRGKKAGKIKEYLLAFT